MCVRWVKIPPNAAKWNFIILRLAKKEIYLFAILAQILECLSGSSAHFIVRVIETSRYILQLVLDVFRMHVNPLCVPRNDEKCSIADSGMIWEGRYKIHYLWHSIVV